MLFSNLCLLAGATVLFAAGSEHRGLAEQRLSRFHHPVHLCSHPAGPHLSHFSPLSPLSPFHFCHLCPSLSLLSISMSTQQSDGVVSRLYGSALSFYEEYDEALLTDHQRKLLRLDQFKDVKERRVLTNKCLCLLSQWPFFEAFQRFLFFLYKRLLMGPYDIPIERLISHFLYSVPFPR